jgi:pimeloyl-ACP methyl ester carboxylesterase
VSTNFTPVEPYSVSVPEIELASLRDRLRATRWPERETIGGTGQGVPLAEMQALCRYWAEEYDWRRCEQAINAFAQVRVSVDKVRIHALHVRSREAEALPLVLTHGWPGSVLEFLDVIGPLSDPVAYGGDPHDAFHVVVPSLPGYGFSDRPTEPGWNPDRIAAAWVELMRVLGYERFAAQGGDWGAAVTTSIGRKHPESVFGIHLNMPFGRRPAEVVELDARDQQKLARQKSYQRQGSGYALQQGTRPQTVGYGLVDSPVALCAWIVEKLVDWSDNRDGPALSRDALLDTVTLYWLTATGASSARLYWEVQASWDRGAVSVPTGVSVFPQEILQTPRLFAEQVYRDIRYWNEVDVGGHFAAWEQPAIFVEEVRNYFRLLRA